MRNTTTVIYIMIVILNNHFLFLYFLQGGGGGGGGGCEDLDEHCRHWAKHGECHKKHRDWMKENCCKSCKGNT